MAEPALERGYFLGLEILRIGAWKSARGLALLTLNTEEDFRSVTGGAIRAIAQLRNRTALDNANDDEYWAEWMEVAGQAAGVSQESGLMKLQGIDYPMASAILAILDPDVWPVLDRWACSTVFGPDAVPGKQQLPARLRRKAKYAVYARHLVTQGHRCWPNAETIHDLDQIAMAASMPAGRLPEGWRFAEL